MARKRKARKDDPNQLMLFSLEEMSGEGELSNGADGADGQNGANGSNGLNGAEQPDDEVIEHSSDDEVIEPSSTGVELMSNVIRLLDSLSPSVVRLVAMQSAALVQGGVDSLEHYRIPSLSGMVFRGDALERVAYASFVRSFPNMVDKLGLDFSAEYEAAE